jgi:hypothetical protein
MAYIGNSPTSAGNYQIIDDISGSFNGSTTNFALAVGGVSISPGQTGQVIAAVNGIVQEPDDAGSAGFRIVNNTIVFAAAPTSGHAFWGVFQGSTIDVGIPSNDAVDAVHLKTNSVTNVKMADDAIGLNELSATGTASSTAFLRGDNSWAALSIDSGQLVAGSVDLSHMSANSVDSDQYTNGSIDTIHIGDDQVTADKLANSINTAIAANTAKVTNAITTHTGDVTGGTALTIAATAVETGMIADDAVTTAKLNLISTASIPSIEARSDGTTDGYIRLNCSSNSHGINLKSPPHSASASYTLTFPTTDGNANELLMSNGSGVLSWSKISSSQMSGLSTLLIINSAGTTVKTIHGAGS